MRPTKKKLPPASEIDWDAVRDFRALILRNKLPPRKLRIPKRPPDEAVFLASAVWSWSPVSELWDSFYFMEDGPKNLAILWLKTEEEEGRPKFRVVAYWICCIGVPARHSAWVLLEDYLKSARATDYPEPPHEFEAGRLGPLDEEAMEQIQERVWPEEDELEPENRQL